MEIITNNDKQLTDYFGDRWMLTDAKTGKNIVEFTSFIDADIKAESKVVTGPIEQGSFASYNKVENPNQIKVTLGISGDTAQLQNAINQLEKYAGSTDLVCLVTPTAEYEDMNLERFDYQLKRETGRGALYVSLSLVEIRQVQAAYTNVKLAPLHNRGKVQTKPVGTSKGAGAGSGSGSEKQVNRSVFRSAGNAYRGWMG